MVTSAVVLLVDDWPAKTKETHMISHTRRFAPADRTCRRQSSIKAILMYQITLLNQMG